MSRNTCSLILVAFVTASLIPSASADVTPEQKMRLSELSDEFREAIILRELDGLSYEEIAEALECPIGTVRSRIHRAREELRAILMRSDTT